MTLIQTLYPNCIAIHLSQQVMHSAELGVQSSKNQLQNSNLNLDTKVEST